MTTTPGPSPDLLVRPVRRHVRRTRPGLPAAACRRATGAVPASPGRGRPTVRLVLPAGDLRSQDAAALRSLLRAAAGAGGDVVLDAEAVESVDAAVVGVLLGLDRELRAHGTGVRLEGARPRLVRALGVAGATGLLAG